MFNFKLFNLISNSKGNLMDIFLLKGYDYSTFYLKSFIRQNQCYLILSFTLSSAMLFSQEEINREKILLRTDNVQGVSVEVNDYDDYESRVLNIVKSNFSEFNDFELQRLELMRKNPYSKEQLDLLDETIDEFAISKGFSFASITSTGTYREFSEHQIKSYKHVEELEKMGVGRSNNRQ